MTAPLPQSLHSLVAAAACAFLLGACGTGDLVNGPGQNGGQADAGSGGVDGGPQGCFENKDCPADQYCLNGSCVSPDGGCKAHADCPAGQYCSDGTCTKPGGQSSGGASSGGRGGSSGGKGGSSGGWGGSSGGWGGSSGGGSSGGRNGGPGSCKTDSDCKGKCPPNIKQCGCADTPGGKFCVPTCSADKDCPQFGKTTMTCTQQGHCAPEKKGGGGGQGGSSGGKGGGGSSGGKGGGGGSSGGKG